jgi:hypothetical protein
LNAPTTLPEPDELEISLFGPGFGECVVVHAGCGDWIVVDSCIGPDGRTPAGLDCLKRIGVDASMSVQRIVATHWHNDHVRGIAQTVAACPSAKFICSQALWSKEFISLTELWKSQGLPASPIAELAGVLDHLTQSNALLKGSSGYSPLGFAIANRCLWRRGAVGDAATDTSAELHSLSPSDAAVQRSLQVIAELFTAGRTLTRPLPSRPNQFSVALWLRFGDVRALLGADMEEQNNPHGGWTVIVGSAERPDGQTQIESAPRLPMHSSQPLSVSSRAVAKPAVLIGRFTKPFAISNERTIRSGTFAHAGNSRQAGGP